MEFRQWEKLDWENSSADRCGSAGNDKYGIFPMIIGSLYITGGAIVVGVPIGIFTAVFLAKYCPEGLYKIMKPATELLAGIPSVVYGFFRIDGNRTGGPYDLRNG